jgi:hypothetical protein
VADVPNELTLTPLRLIIRIKKFFYVQILSSFNSAYLCYSLFICYSFNSLCLQAPPVFSVLTPLLKYTLRCRMHVKGFLINRFHSSLVRVVYVFVAGSTTFSFRRIQGSKCCKIMFVVLGYLSIILKHDFTSSYHLNFIFQYLVRTSQETPFVSITKNSQLM